MKYKTIFIVDPVRGERIHLSKFIMQEFFTVMSFVSIADCFKPSQVLNCDLVIYVLRTGKTETKHLLNIKKKFKQLPFIVVVPENSPEPDLTQLKEQGFTSLNKATNNEKVRELVLGFLAKEGLPPRTEVPHPVPIGIDLGPPQPLKQ
jgi:DNA-binding NtrC family response regulator